MRLFVAIDISAEVRSQIEELLANLRRLPAPVRWSRPEGMHITLKFVGEAPSNKVEEIAQQLGSVPAASALTIHVRGAGFFPSERAPRVIWLGIRAGDELAELAGNIDATLVSLGVPKETRAFSPHLTLGRVRAPDSLIAVRELLRKVEPDMGSFTASDYYLYESRLAPGGSVYQKIARFPLGNAGGR
jgi:2'-5' RNA ligase